MCAFPSSVDMKVKRNKLPKEIVAFAFIGDWC